MLKVKSNMMWGWIGCGFERRIGVKAASKLLPELQIIVLEGGEFGVQFFIS